MILWSDRHHAQLMVQFGDVLTANPDRPLRISDICSAIGVSERALETCCLEILGMALQDICICATSSECTTLCFALPLRLTAKPES
jgi:AraC-like DNA-binding protein